MSNFDWLIERKLIWKQKSLNSTKTQKQSPTKIDVFVTARSSGLVLVMQYII